MASGTYVSGVNAEGRKLFLSGGTASGFILYGNDSQNVAGCGRTAIGTVVASGGSMYVAAGATALGVIQHSGGHVNAPVSSGAFVSGTNAKGRTMLLSGGTASGFILYGGSFQYVHSGCTAIGTEIYSGGEQSVLSGGTAIGTILSGGKQRGKANLIGTIVKDRGSQAVQSYAWNSVISAGGIQNVCGGTAFSTVLSSGGRQEVRGYAPGTVVSKGGSQIVSAGAASGTVVLSGGVQKVRGGAASCTVVSSGGAMILSGGTALSAVILSGAQASVSSTAVLRSAIVSGGGSLRLSGIASCMVLRGGAAIFSAASGAVIYGSNRIDAVKSAGGTVRLASGASLTMSGKASASGLAVSASAGLLAFSGAGARLKAISLTKDTAVAFDIGKLKAGAITVLKTATKNKQKVGAFSVTVVVQQQMGSYGITQNVVQAKNTAWTVTQRGKELGTVKLNGSGFSNDGVTYRLTAAKDKISLTLSAKAGKTLKGTDAGETVKGTKDSDVFWGGRGNDDFRNGAGRDCAVYGKENWGRDTITKTAGTLALLFKDLKASDVTTSLSGTTMTVTKKADVKQTVTIADWDEKRHSLVFGGTMKAVDAWIKAASPTAAQTTAARNEVWQKAGLAAA